MTVFKPTDLEEAPQAAGRWLTQEGYLYKQSLESGGGQGRGSQGQGGGDTVQESSRVGQGQRSQGQGGGGRVQKHSGSEIGKKHNDKSKHKNAKTS